MSQILSFVVPIKAFSKVWSSTFRIVLKPVDVARIDMVEARLDDVEEEMDRVCCSGKQRISTLIEFEVLAGAAEDDSRRSLLRWTEVTSECFTVEEDGAIRSLVAGTFLVTLLLSCAVPSSRQPSSKSTSVQSSNEEERCYIVDGAGYANMNGVYKSSGVIHDDCQTYTCTAGDVEYTLYRFCMHNKQRR